MIEVEDVFMEYPLMRRYREMLLAPFAERKVKVALDGVSLSIGKSERVAFLGPNGAGKTSLLKLIAGLLLPTKGTVRVNGFDTVADSARARRSISLVLNEERSFYWRLSGRENLEFFGALENLRGADLKRRLREVIDISGLAEAADQPVGGYSSGMKQRLALARGLLSDPDILILDEPSRALDPLASSEMASFLLDTLYRGLNKSLLIATHRLDEAAKLCDRLVLLSGGRIRADKSLSEAQAESPDLLGFYVQGVAP